MRGIVQMGCGKAFRRHRAQIFLQVGEGPMRMDAVTAELRVLNTLTV